MAVNASDAMTLGRGVGSAVRPDVDRWIFVFMAALFVATALVGFIPSSIEKLAAIEAGRRLPFPPVLHVHAVLMGTWLMLLLTQASLVATGRRALHRKLGLAAFALMPAIVVTGLILVPTMHRMLWGIDGSLLPAPAAASIAESKIFVSNILLLQIRMGILFPVFVIWALSLRRKDPETHKRLMILASVVPLAAAIDRIGWLPTTLPASPVSPDLYMLVWILPMLAFDIVRRRRVPRAYVIWCGVGLPFMIVPHLLWGTSWWLATATKLVGVAGP
jgi:hypothetical protein